MGLRELEALTLQLHEKDLRLKESEAMYRSLCEASPHCILLMDKDKGSVYQNTYWFNITGLIAEESEASGWLNAIPKDERPELLKKYDESFNTENETYFNGHLICHNQKLVAFDFTGIPIKEYQKAIWVAVMIDVKTSREKTRRGDVVEKPIICPGVVENP